VMIAQRLNHQLITLRWWVQIQPPLASGERKYQRKKFFLNSVYRPELKWYTHLPLHHQLHCKSCCLNLASDASSEVEQSTNNPKVVGSNTALEEREKRVKKVFLNSIYRPELKWYTHLPLHHQLHCKSCFIR
jgi:hypothetical protein